MHSEKMRKMEGSVKTMRSGLGHFCVFVYTKSRVGNQNKVHYVKDHFLGVFRY